MCIRDRKGKYYYIEVKLADIAKLNYSLRTFYYMLSELTKVKHDAYHIGVGFVHSKKKILGVKLFDISKIRVSLKPEFNASYREVYQRGNIIREYWEAKESHP